MVLKLIQSRRSLTIDDSGSRYLQVKEASFTYKWNKGRFMIARNLMKLVNGETSLVEVKRSAWTKLNDKAWQAWKNAKESSCLPYTG